MYCMRGYKSSYGNRIQNQGWLRNGQSTYYLLLCHSYSLVPAKSISRMTKTIVSLLKRRFESKPHYLGIEPSSAAAMTFSEDEDLLNSDEGSEKEEKSLEKENSITAIISDGSSESEMSVEEEEDDEIAQGNARAFSDKDNQWIKLKKNMDDSEEEEEGDSEEEMVGNGRCFVIA